MQKSFIFKKNVCVCLYIHLYMNMYMYIYVCTVICQQNLLTSNTRNFPIPFKTLLCIRTKLAFTYSEGITPCTETRIVALC